MLGAGLKHHLGVTDLGTVLGANNHGAKLAVKIYGAMVPAKSPPRLRRAQDLGARIDGAETCKLGTTNVGTELRIQILKTYVEGHIEKFQKKTKK